jgi:uncharacterized repeat protein (TIGR01451 family)
LTDDQYGDVTNPSNPQLTSTNCSLVVINPGATYTCSFGVSFTSNVAGTYTDKVTASGTDDEGNTTSASATATVTVTRPQVSIAKTVDKATANNGDTLTYTVAYQNTGTAKAYTVTVQDQIPAQTTYTAGSATGAGSTIEFSPNGSTWYPTEAAVPGGSSAIKAIRWTIAQVDVGVSGTLGFQATVNYPTADGTPITNTAQLTKYCSRSGSLEKCYTGNSSTATTTVQATPIGSTSTMTDSSFQLKDDLGPWTITDFEILLNSKNQIVATNPGQFYYHQRVTNTFVAPTNMEFTINWPQDFTAQTGGGQPIHAYVQLATDPANTWTDWTPQSTGICSTYSSPADNVNPTNAPACAGSDGTITVNNVPAGAKVWVTVHLDYALKGTTQASNFTQKPISYGPFSSAIKIRDKLTGAFVGTSYSQTSLLGRGKKVTVVYGTMVDTSGAAMANVWIRLTQNGASYLAHTQADGSYVFYDGQACTGDGLDACSAGPAGTLNFANGTVNTTFALLGQGTSQPAISAPTSLPSGKSSATVTGTGGTNNVGASATSTLSVAKGSAYNRAWKFS